MSCCAYSIDFEVACMSISEDLAKKKKSFTAVNCLHVTCRSTVISFLTMSTETEDVDFTIVFSRLYCTAEFTGVTKTPDCNLTPS